MLAMLIALEAAQTLADATPIAAGTLATILSLLAIFRRQLAKNEAADAVRDTKIADIGGEVRGVAAEIKLLGSEVKAALLESEARLTEKLNGVERAVIDRIEGHGSRLAVVETRQAGARNGRRSSEQ